MSENNKPATEHDDDHRFEAVTARYMRVNMQHHNLNNGLHVVEVRVFEGTFSSSSQSAALSV
jgi:hypothetical protein